MTTCDVDGCQRSDSGGARGWCSAHYNRWWKHGDVQADKPIREVVRDRPDICEIDGCNRKHNARGWCKHHYGKWRRHGDPETETTWSRAKHSTLEPAKARLYWAAGLIEGDGTFFRDDRANVHVVTVRMTDSEPIERLTKLFGGNGDYVIERDEPRQDVYQWIAYGARARGIMMTLYSLMCPRRQKQIRDALDDIHGP